MIISDIERESFGKMVMLFQWVLVISGAFLFGFFTSSVLSAGASEDAFREGWKQGVSSVMHEH